MKSSKGKIADKDAALLSPIISIVMPTYNTSLEYLNESVESVMKQTFGDFELLVIDDGSTETQGVEWLKTLKDQRIILIQNNHDFIESLNRGIAESQGKYIVRMDADDIMMPNRLQVQYDFMEEHPEIDVCGSWMETFGNKNDTIRVHTEHKEITASLLLYNTMVHPTIMLRKASVCNNKTSLYKKGYNSAEDYKLWTDLAMEGLRFANIPEILLKYRCSENQVTNIRQKEMISSSQKIRLEYAEVIIEMLVEGKKQYESFFNELIDLYNNQFISVSTFLRTIYNFLS